MKKLIILTILFTTSIAMASEKCYVLSRTRSGQSRTPELLCVNQSSKGKAVITLKTGHPWNRSTVATFNFAYLRGARCMGCNKNVYGVKNPGNSLFNKLKVEFNGEFNRETNEERGTVKIGRTRFHYLAK